MSGHSKWAQIKRQKAVTDATRSRVFSRYARLLTIEAKKAGPDGSSPGLTAAIQRAKAANMPKDNIERALAKGSSKDADSLEAIQYELYGPGGAALVVDALTDNKNRTTQEIKHLISKLGYELSNPGAAAWAFARNSSGVLVPHEPLVEIAEEDEERFSTLLSALEEHGDVQDIATNARGYESSRD